MRSRNPRRPLAFLVHSLLGLKLSLFTLFVCATGTIAVISDDLEWLYRPEVRASVSDRTVSWGRQYAAAQAAYPRYTIDFATAGEEPYLATRFLSTSPAGETRIVYVDPATGGVTGESGWVTLPSVMRAMHYYLFVPGDWAFYAVTALGFVLMASLVSGLLVYKKFWRGFFTAPRRTRGDRVLWGDLHRLIGLWSLWFVFVIALTSVWYLGERVLYRAGMDLDPPRAVIDATALDALGPATPAHLPLDALIEIGKAQLPGLIVRELWFPAMPEEPLFIRGQAMAWLVRDRTNGVELNPYTGNVLAVHRAEAMPLLERWVHTADPLHFGDFGGLPSKLVWFVFGLAMCASAVSGAVIFVKRTREAVRAHSSDLGQAPWPRFPRFDFMGRWAWPNLLAITALPAFAFVFSWVPSFAPEQVPERLRTPVQVGPWSVTVGTGGSWPPPLGSRVTWSVRFCEGCYREIRSAALGVGGSDQPPVELSRISGNANAASASIVVTRQAHVEPLHLWLELEGWDGQRHVRSWKPPP